MARSAVSDADRRLISTLAGEGLSVSGAQLERWRSHGLLPRATVVRNKFGGSQIAPHQTGVVAACRELARLSSRGRVWQNAACELFDEGHVLSTTAVRAAARWYLDLQLRPLRRAWTRAEAGAEVSGADPAQWVETIAHHAAEILGPSLRRAIEEEVQLAHPNTGRRRLRPLVDKAVAWRIADLCVPQLLNEEQRRWARTGSAEPLDPLGYLVLPLPSERAACIESLTWAEMRIARHCLIVRESPLLNLQHTIGAASWWVTSQRLYASFDHAEQPLSDQYLLDEVTALDDIEWEVEGQDFLPGFEDLD